MNFTIHDAEIAPGWQPVITRLLNMLAKVKGLEVHQIKQKFGGLRCYTNNDHSLEVIDIVDYFDVICQVTCEVCGERGERWKQTSGWISVVCRKHRK